MKNIVIIGLILLAAILSGCGARKTTTTHTEQNHELQAVLTDNTQTNTDTNIQEVCESEEEGITYAPINPDKPMVITEPDGKKTTVDNGTATRHKKKSSSTATIKKQEQVKTDITIQVKEKDQVQTKDKGVQKEPAIKADLGPWLGPAIALCIIGGFIYFIWRKKSKNENDTSNPA